MDQRFGATPEEWAHFVNILRLGADLLPVVSNPNATISPNSKMRQKGKVPSRYNRARNVAGFSEWTSYKANSADIARWSAEPDYGICLQTRLVRALDIDVDDHDKAEAIANFIASHIGLLPRRLRPGSGKQLLAFSLPGEYAKRVIKVDGGIIEFLANGQQFIACGTHPKGQRYLWEFGLPDDLPAPGAEQFEALWAALVAQFAIEAPSTGGGLRKAKPTNIGELPNDQTADFIERAGIVTSYGKEGQSFFECPFSSEHTTDTGESSCCYFPRGTRGYERGHFVCLHSHCDGRTDEEFLDALGIRASEFEIINDNDILHRGDGDSLPRAQLPNFNRNKAGEILSTKRNLQAALSRPDICKWDIRFDTFRDEIMYAPEGTEQWRPFADEDYFYLCAYLEGEGFTPIGRELIRDAVLAIARLRRFDSAIKWLSGLVWDGVPRIEQFLTTYMGAEDTEYVRAVSLYMWTALAGRVMVPGEKADMVPILEGKQGIRKSSAVAAMAPAQEFFCNISFHESDENLSRKVRGRLVAEIGELRGLHTKELEAIKEWIAKRYENWVPKYREFPVNFPRRLLFIGTTNKTEILADETGNRRWLPVHVTRADVDGIVRDRDQLWAEGKALFELIGVNWSAEHLADEAHQHYMVHDSWDEVFAGWLRLEDVDGSKPEDRDFLLTSEILREAFGMEAKNIKRFDEMRISKILRIRNFQHVKKRVNGKPAWVWAKNVPTS